MERQVLPSQALSEVGAGLQEVEEKLAEGASQVPESLKSVFVLGMREQCVCLCAQ